jgi:hypothetical protein
MSRIETTDGMNSLSKIAIVLFCALVLIASGCGKKEESAQRRPNQNETSQQITPESPNQPRQGDTPSPPIGATTATDNEVLYKVAIERYFNSYIKADLDNLLDSLHPDGPMYPSPAAIEQLRATASSNALQGRAEVKDITVLEEGADRARVKVTLFMRVDVNGNGTFQEETSYPTCELRLKDGKWRLFNAETQ